MKKARLKFVTRLKYGDAFLQKDNDEGEIPVFGSNGVFSTNNYTNTEAPTIILGRKGSYGKVNWSQEKCFATDTTFFIDDTATKNDLRWVFYLLQSLQLDEGSNEAAVPGLSRETAYNKEVFFPDFPTQRRIATYLDRETAQIDALIAAKERLLLLLAEKRQALITRAVTRGLDPAVKMKDSGVEWLGEVPEHWEVRRTKWLFRERNERSVSGDEEMLTVSHITGITARSEKDVNMFEAESNEGYKLVYKNDFVINTLWAWMGAMGVSALDGIVSPAYHVYIVSTKLEPMFVDAISRMPLFAAEVTRFSKGVWSSRLRLYPEGLFEVFFPVPTIREQQEIVKHIIVETSKIDNLRSTTERSIILLKERRSALISAAVTGQLTIPD